MKLQNFSNKDRRIVRFARLREETMQHTRLGKIVSNKQMKQTKKNKNPVHKFNSEKEFEANKSAILNHAEENIMKNNLK